MNNFMVEVQSNFELFKIMHQLELDSMSDTIEYLIRFFIEHHETLFIIN